MDVMFTFDINGGAITVVTIAPIEVVQLFVSHAKHVSTAAASSATRVHIQAEERERERQPARRQLR